MIIINCKVKKLEKNNSITRLYKTIYIDILYESYIFTLSLIHFRTLKRVKISVDMEYMNSIYDAAQAINPPVTFLTTEGLLD